MMKWALLLIFCAGMVVLIFLPEQRNSDMEYLAKECGIKNDEYVSGAFHKLAQCVAALKEQNPYAGIYEKYKYQASDGFDWPGAWRVDMDPDQHVGIKVYQEQGMCTR